MSDSQRADDIDECMRIYNDYNTAERRKITADHSSHVIISVISILNLTLNM